MQIGDHPSLDEIRDIVLVLQEQLAKLDEIGAGISAIHVDAAIEQLANNFETICADRATEYDPSMICMTPKSGFEN